MKIIAFTVFLLMVHLHIKAQNQEDPKLYVGILPAVLAEPYDTIDALEVNIFPLVYEYKFQHGKSDQSLIIGLSNKVRA